MECYGSIICFEGSIICNFSVSVSHICHCQKAFDFTAAGVVPCGGRETSPRTSTIVQFIFYFGPLRSAIIF